MFEIKPGQDRIQREYKYVFGTDDKLKKQKVYLILPVFNEEQYLNYCLESFKGQVDGIFAVDNGSTDASIDILKKHGVRYVVCKNKDQSVMMNKILKWVPKGSWVLFTDADQVLFDLPKDHIRRYATFLEDNNIYCSDVRNLEICYNYGTVLGIDWGDGPGVLWTARRLFKYTGTERFVGYWHKNISNVHPKQKGSPSFNNEHTGQWVGPVVKTHSVVMFHYGKCSGIERWRDKAHRAVIDTKDGAMGMLPTIPYHGKHPSVMGL